MNKPIAVYLLAAIAALGQQHPTPPPKLYIPPGHRTTGAVLKRCPGTVTVTGTPESAQYRMDIIQNAGFSGTLILYDKAGNPVAIFDGSTFKIHKMADRICKYFEDLKAKEKKQ
jgi:hypothetical protein